MISYDYRKSIENIIDNHFAELWEMSEFIHANPELAFEEFKAAKVQTDYLEKQGFAVERGVANLDTAFVATFVSGNGKPAIGIVSEYDALPIGHACGHNLISISAVGAALAVKKHLEKSGESCTLKVFGTPAEEAGGGKIIMLKEGVFEGTDAVLMMHPTSDISRLAGECLSSMRIKVSFIGKSAHAGSHPEKGINALSAATLFLNGCGLLRQRFKGDARLSSVITKGGETTGLIPEAAEVESSVSCFSLADLENYTRMISDCAKGTALAMGCEVEITIKEGYQGRIRNETLSNICKEELAYLKEDLLPGLPIDYGGEDLGNVSRVIPICNPYITIFKDYKISNHTNQFKELAISDSGKRCLEISAKSMAMTAMRFVKEPQILQKAKEELKMRLEKERG
ncbi:MAG TPA: M20 family metallopeptidase [Erysipelotrichaceae bacterium]|nr:M20 family metallopeptidase [Erysipelotrichaceae bacterium]HQB31989.1 M20 family metallopeptidase [Erysipelotrichaceae bacterium]